MQRRFVIPSKRKDYLIGPLLPSQASPDLHVPSPSQHRQKLPANQSSSSSRLPSSHISLLNGLRSPEALKRQVLCSNTSSSQSSRFAHYRNHIRMSSKARYTWMNTLLEVII
ncbi:hypothetical protein ES332_D06G187800v1 [Gossypium tomentosum]|uniref:Uncharacterized protein n=1 Tax=Gossypium tomentosum TaxID=34277 RepID=A0A5D2KJT7_GOSTO|nr:hypothetical protein ES332_D06G187800v1 [Gossypium tomentosum]